MLADQHKENELSQDGAQSEVNNEVNASENEIIEQIDDSIAKETSEKVLEKTNEVTIAVVDYSVLSLEDLLKSFEKLYTDFPIQKINQQVNEIKSVFASKYHELVEDKKAKFIEEGGESIDFKYSNPTQVSFNTLFHKYKDARSKYYKSLEKDLQQNLELRLALIEELKELVEKAEPSTMYNVYKAIHERWNKIGPVPKEKYNDTWRTFHYHVERFYDLLHLNNEFRDLDFKYNLEKKSKLIERVEALASEENINYAFNELQEIHREWKEDIGPVAKDLREEVWGKFSEATKVIHDKRQAYYKTLKEQQALNKDKKLAVIEEIEKVDYTSNKTHSDWQKSIKQFEVLKEQFFAVGQVLKADSEFVWQKFKEATKGFNKAKNNFYKEAKGVQSQNLEAKQKLVEIAKSCKNGDLSEEAVNTVKKIQADWKKIGHVPHKYSDKIWKQFKGACNDFFDRYHASKKEGEVLLEKVATKKKEVLEQLKSSVDLEAVSLDAISGYVAEWKELGESSHKFRHIEEKFMKFIESLYAKLPMTESEKQLHFFKLQTDALMSHKDFKKLNALQVSIRKNIDELKKESYQLENNIGFFANAKKENPLLQKVQHDIEKNNKEIEILKKKLNQLKKLDY